MFVIVPEQPEHAPALPALLDAAFGADRLKKRSYHYRRGVPRIEDLAFVALRDSRVVGAIAFWPVSIGATHAEALLLGPLAVEPVLKGQGIGRGLMWHGLERAREGGHGRVVLVGDLDYYAQFGFRPAVDAGVAMPGEARDRLLFRAMVPDAFAGVRGAVRRATVAAEAPAA